MVVGGIRDPIQFRTALRKALVKLNSGGYALLLKRQNADTAGQFFAKAKNHISSFYRRRQWPFRPDLLVIPVSL